MRVLTFKMVGKKTTRVYKVITQQKGDGVLQLSLSHSTTQTHIQIQPHQKGGANFRYSGTVCRESNVPSPLSAESWQPPTVLRVRPGGSQPTNPLPPWPSPQAQSSLALNQWQSPKLSGSADSAYCLYCEALSLVNHKDNGVIWLYGISNTKPRYFGFLQ